MDKEEQVYIYIDEEGIKIVNKHEEIIIEALLHSPELLPGYIVRADKIYAVDVKSVPQVSTSSINLTDNRFWDGTEKL